MTGFYVFGSFMKY